MSDLRAALDAVERKMYDGFNPNVHPIIHRYAQEVRAALAATPEPTLDAGERAALDMLRGLRITGDDIDAALNDLGPTGDRAEAYVKVAAATTASALRLLVDARLHERTEPSPEAGT